MKTLLEAAEGKDIDTDRICCTSSPGPREGTDYQQHGRIGSVAASSCSASSCKILINGRGAYPAGVE